MSSVVVLGAGIVGLSTALRLLQQNPELKVALVSDKFDQDTTSYGAAGIFRPTVELIKGVPQDVLIGWVEASWKFYMSLATTAEAAEAGISLVSGYHMLPTGASYKEPNLLRILAPNYRQMTEEEWKMFANDRRDVGVTFTSVLVDPSWYLKWLMKKFVELGGHVERRYIRSFEELSGSCDLVVNCTGLRARELEPDPLLVANRGQVMRVHAPWIKHFVYLDMNTWIIPCLDSVVVGGTRQHDDNDTRIRQEDIKEVWERACSVLPSLRKAKILGVWPGLRPYRTPLRLESETRTYHGKPLKILHHYGHGGNGIGISWGTAGHAVSMANKLLGNHSKL